MNIEKLNLNELVSLHDEVNSRILKLIRDEALKTKSKVILEVGKKYKTAQGETIVIYDRYLAVFRGRNTTTISKNPNDKFPEFYINGRRSRDRISQNDIISEAE